MGDGADPRVEAHAREPGDEGFRFDMKRCYLPFTISANCPKCGDRVQRDLRDHYLTYPQVGPAFAAWLCCSNEPCYHEFAIGLVLGVTLDVITSPPT